MKQKLVSVALSIIILIMSFPLSVKEVQAATPDRVANLVLFVSFSDTDPSYWNKTVSYYNETGAEMVNYIYNESKTGGNLCAKDYFDIVSCGKMELVNVMPQMTKTDSGITIQPITLDISSSSYLSSKNDYRLITEIVQKFNQNSTWKNQIAETLDFDGNSYIDNVTFLVAWDDTHASEPGRDSSLYPHKANATADWQLEIKDKKLGSYNIINSMRLFSVTGRAGIVAHEFLHVLGPLDTYTSSGSTDPVNCWDIMADSSARVQYPLAYTRKELGWIDIPEITESKTYTLTTPQLNSNGYAMILRTPYSDKEFFVLEYRKLGTAGVTTNKVDLMDTGIGGSGLIIYRVNTDNTEKSNLTSDYIYLFRAGESETEASREGARRGYLSAESGRTSFGSNDPAVTSAANAITYTDGTNSGIIIKNVGSAGNTITFDVEYSIDLTDDYWEPASFQSLSMSNGMGIDAALWNGQLYGSNFKLASYNGKLYGLCSNNNFQAELFQYSNGSWQSVKVLTGQYSNDMDMEAGSDGLYLVCEQNNSTLKVFRMDASNNLTDITASIPTPGKMIAAPKITVTGKGTVIAYRDLSGKIYVYLKNGSSWKALTLNNASGNAFQVCSRGNIVYLAVVNGNGNYVYQCNLGSTETFQKVGGEFSTNTATSVDLVQDDKGIVYVAYLEQGVVQVKGYQNGTWNQLGMNVHNSQSIGDISLMLENGVLYAAYKEGSTIGIKRHIVFGTTGTVTVPIQSVTLNKKQASVEVGKTLTLQATINPQNTTQSKTLTWSSSNTNVAVVNSNGTVTGKAAGTAVITVKTSNGKTATCTVTVTRAYTDTEAFVVRLYSTCLGRQPDESGLTYWNQTLVRREKSGAVVGYGFVFSEEYKARNVSNEEFVEMLYNVFMNRLSEPTGKAYWVDLLNQGISREYVFRGFAHSQEYTDICRSYGIERGTISIKQARDRNPNLTMFINRIYEQAMGRKGEEDGLNYWCSTIQNREKTPVQVAESFILSEEFKNKHLSDEEYIKVLYRTFMGREYDDAGLNYWLGQLRNGSSRETVLRRFAGCQEFKEIVASFGLK